MLNNSEKIKEIYEQIQRKIFFVIPIYNVEAFLPKCLDSVLSQTYKNLEIIIVDDGSTDGCAEICDKYAQLFSNVTVILPVKLFLPVISIYAVPTFILFL